MATSTYPSMTGAVDNTSAAKFIPEIWREIGKFSTEMRGGMNIIVKLLNTNLYNDSDNLIKPGEMISEILNDIFDRDSNLENFYRKVKSTLDLDDNSIELNIIKLLFVFRDGLWNSGENPSPGSLILNE